MIGIHELSQLDSFYIETSAQDRFKLIPKEDGFSFIDVNPPIFEKEIHDFKSAKFLATELNMIQAGKSIDISKALFFEGIAKGYSFVFYDERGFAITNGRIETLYTKQSMGNFSFNIHLLEQPGKKIDLERFAGNFEIITDTASYKMTLKDERHYFEGREFIGIYSLFKVKSNTSVNNLKSLRYQYEYDVHAAYLYMNKPFIIVTKDTSSSQYKLSLILENVKKVVAF